jgi:Legionella pneumophila major outer membrane protein precursor
MLKKVMSLALAAAMLQGAASANLFCGNVWVAGEALLLRPSGGYPFLVILGPAQDADEQLVTVPVGDQLAICPGYESGYKVEVGYRNCDKEVLVNWLSWNNSYGKTIEADGENTQLWNTQTSTFFQASSGRQPIVSRIKDVYKYDALDAEIAKSWCKECSKWSARAFLGLRYARIARNTAAEAVFTNSGDVVVLFARRSDVQGTGPRAGLGGRWNLWCDFGLTGSVAGHLLIGSAKSQHFDSVPAAGDTILANVKNRKYCRIIPASEIKFGLDWKGCLFCGFSGELGVGYQISHYFYGDQTTLFTQSSSSTGTNHVHTNPMSFDGWYFRIGLGY